MTSYLGAFHAKWECPAKPSGRTGARAQMDALAALDLVVPGETIWRAIFDPTRPGEAERFMGDSPLCHHRLGQHRDARKSQTRREGQPLTRPRSKVAPRRRPPHTFGDP